MAFLGTALAATYEPAANVKGDVVAATWLLLLDRLDGIDVVVAGSHAPVTMTAIDAVFPRWRPPDGSRADLVVVAPGEPVPAGAADVRTTVVRVGGAGDGEASLVVGGAGLDDGGRVARVDVPFVPERPRSALAARSQRVLARAAVRLGNAAPAVARTEALSLRAGPLRQGTSLAFGGDVDARELPGYVRRVAGDRAGAFEGRRWSLIPAADYWSQKALFLVDDTAIKVSRLPRFSARLHNEHAGLVWASSSGWIAAGRCPIPLFAGSEAGLAVTGQERVTGEPFEDATDGTARCPVLARALAGVRELTTVSSVPVSDDEARAAYAELVGALARVATPSGTALSVLARDGTVAASAGVGVAVHGDAAPWNLVVRPGGVVCFFDWENFEPCGPPVWDAALLVQAAGAMATRRRGGRYTAATFANHLLADSPWRSTLEREAGGVDRGLVWPLVRLWLAFQALKEATRHPAGHRGLYANALEAACARS